MVLDPGQKLYEGERVIELLDSRQVDQLSHFSINSQRNKIFPQRQNALEKKAKNHPQRKEKQKAVKPDQLGRKKCFHKPF